MNPWFARILTVLFVLSLLATPQLAATAQEPAATPVVVADTGSGSEEGTPVEPGSTPDSIDTGQDPAVASTPESGVQQRPSLAGKPEMGINAISGSFAFADPTYDVASETLTVSVTFDNGFSADVGDTFSIAPGWTLQVLPFGPTLLTNVPEATVTLDELSGEILITFTEDYAVTGGSVTGSATLSVDVPGLECKPGVAAYVPWADLWFIVPGTVESRWVEYRVNAEEECAAITEPTIDWAGYDAHDSVLEIETLHIGPTVAGQQVTLTYPIDKLAMDAGPFEVMRYSVERNRDVVVGSATASNGLITITFIDTGIEGEWDDYSDVELTGGLISATCADSTEAFVAELGDLEFVTNTGYTFVTDYYSSVLCNAAPASKTGEWSTDGEGNPIIIWTIDTGDIYQGGTLQDYAEFGGFWFNCTDTSPIIETISGSFDYDLWTCGEWGVGIDFWSIAGEGESEVFRARVTIVATLDQEYVPTVYLNCARVYSDLSEDMDRMSTAAANNGYGGEACAELFPPDGGGDAITKTVDKNEAKPGDTLTYTITASTSADNWDRVTISDTLPAGVVINPDSITCAIEPAVYMEGPCYTLTGNQITSTAWAASSEESWRYESGPVAITITVQGTVATNVAPGSSIVNEACSQRHVNIPGGEGPDTNLRLANICASAVTNVPLPPTPSPTPSPSPTPTVPATPGATPTVPATPGETATATATSAVTGLPETGNGGGSAQGISLLFGVLAASVLVAGAIGMRSRADGRQ